MLDFLGKSEYNKDNKSGNQASHLTRQEENPLPELLSPKGGLFAPCGLPKPLPLGEVALRSNDGEGKPGRKEPLRSDRQAFCQSDTIAVSGIRRQRPSPLSLVALLLASSPKGGALGMSASFRLDERSTISRKQQCSAVWASDSLTRSVV